MINWWDDLRVKKVGAPQHTRMLDVLEHSTSTWINKWSTLPTKYSKDSQFMILSSLKDHFVSSPFTRKKTQNQEQSVIGKGVFVWIINLGDSQLY